MRLAMRRVPGSVLAALVVLAVIVRLGVVVNREIDPDESQHLHIAWLIGQGQVPYRDFWEHHLPLFHYLAAPLTWGLADRPEIYFAARGVMAVAAAGAILLTIRLARRIAPEATPWTALVLMFLPQFAETSTETRPDVPALVAHLASLVAIVRWREGRGQQWLWGAGLAQGLAVALSAKALYGAIGLGAVALLGSGPRRATSSRTADVVRLAAGVAAAPAALLAGLAWHGGVPALAGFGADVVRDSLRFVDFSKTRPAFGTEAGAFGVAAIGLGLAVHRHGWAVLRHPVHGALLPPAAVTAVALEWPWTPAVYQHAWLPLLPGVAVYAGLALSRLGAWARERPAHLRQGVFVAGLLAALVVPAGDSVRVAVRDGNAAQLALMAELLRRACPGEPVLDGTALYVFRPAAYRFGALVTGVREWVARGRLSEDTIAADMRAARARIAHADRRVRGMIGPIAALLRRHYVPAWDGLLVAGARIAAPADARGGRAHVDLLVGGPFVLTAAPHLEVSIDGVPARPGWIALGAGRHRVEWVGAGGDIALRAATCPERRALGRSATSPRP
jgi:hypothetical protein